MNELAPTTGPRRGELWAWAMYDWANSAYSTLSIVVLHNYLLYFVFPQSTWQTMGEVVWAWGLSASMLLAGIASPVVGAWADAHAAKRAGLLLTAWGGSAAALAMALVPTDWPWTIAALFVLVSFCFELSLGFYNGFLPELADEQTMNRVSAAGFALGYVGGGCALIVAMLVLKFGEDWGLKTDAMLRIGLATLGIWWGVFTLPAALMLRDRSRPRAENPGLLQSARTSFAEVGHTLRHIKAYPALALFLVAFLFYNDGVQTVLSQASTFASRELNFTTAELGQVILMIQFVAFPGALAFGWLSDHWNQKAALHGCLTIWCGLLISAYFITEKWQFWLLGAVVALVMGGVQSVSRAIMGNLTPADRTAEFFGFFNLSGKTTSFMGTFVFGLIMARGHSARLAVLSLLVFILLGWFLVSRVDMLRGREQARTDGNT
jgi:UMF1 family MFS transporter